MLVAANSRIFVLAADEPFGPFDTAGLAGSIGISVLNPDGVVQNGLPVSFPNVGSNATFFLSPPGQSVLGANFDAYRPEAAFDGSNRVYVAGYGVISGESPLRGTPGRFYAMTVSGVTTSAGTIARIATMASSPLPVGNGDSAFAGIIPGDYTRPAFARYSGKSVLFWSGPAVLSGGRNLYVTSVPSFADAPAPTTQSGCSLVDDPRRGETGRIPGAAVLLLPAFDSVCQAEPAQDLGQFLAYQRMVICKEQKPEAPMDAEEVERLSELFLSSYISDSGDAVNDVEQLRNRVMAYEIISLIRLAVHSWGKLKGARLYYTVNILKERMPCLIQVC